MEENKKVAREFLSKEFGFHIPEQERLLKMVMIVMANNGNRTLDELLLKAKEALEKFKCPNPPENKIIDMMHAIAIQEAENRIKTLSVE